MKLNSFRLGSSLLAGALIFAATDLHAEASAGVISRFLDGITKTQKSVAKATNGKVAHLTLPQERNQRCTSDEFQIFTIEDSILPSWKKAWMNKDMKAFALFADEGASLIFPEQAKKPTSKINDIQVFNWNTAAKLNGADKLMAEYDKVEDVELALTDYIAAQEKRNPNNTFSEIEGVFKFRITGFDKKGNRRSDRGILRAQIKNTANKWQITKMAPVSGETLTSNRAPAFADVSASLNLNTLPTYQRTEAIRRGGYALAISDINGDKIQDLLVGMRGEIKLLTANDKGEYADVTAGSGLEKLNYVKTAIFADFENRGVQDLVVTTLLPGKNAKGDTSVIVFRGDGKGHFAKKKTDFGKKYGFLQPMPAAVGDFNNDGFMDLYVGYPGIRDFTTFSDRAEKKQVQGLYLNDGKGELKDFTDLMTKSDFDRVDKLFPHSSFAVNFDQMGGIDLLVADDRNNLSPVYVNDGSAQFKEVAQQIGLGNQGYGMSIGAGDFNNDGLTDIVWTNVNFFSSQRAHTACQRHWYADHKYSEEGLRLYKGLGAGKFEEVTLSAKLAGAVGEGAAGMTFLDYDNDGYTDIYVVNGLWSGTRNGQDLSSIFATVSQQYNGPMMHLLKREDHVGFKDVLQNMHGHIDTTTMKVAKVQGERPSLAGFQHNRLLHNNGDGTFTDVGFFEGVDSIHDGYVVGTLINKDGRPDLVLRNGDPGTEEAKFPVVQFFRNNGAGKTPAKNVILTFEGNSFNRDAIGTFVVANYGKMKQVQHLVANSGSLQSERAVQFSMAGMSSIPSIEIHWTSGDVQVLNNVKPGRQHIIALKNSKVSQN